MTEAVNVIGLDVGVRRIGVACGDTSVKIASPLAAIVNDGASLDKVIQEINRTDSKIVVIGLPRNMSGNETVQSDFSRSFARDLIESLKLNAMDDVEVVLQDESLTSVLAEDQLRSRKNFSEAMLRDGTLDSQAAAIILTDFLESGKGGYR